ncbi:alkaline ceramidase 3 isoform X2 [Cricetulus griseus]|uniref:Alkaline ceramidase n=1 Tax=Cricetulus griseus TaxID=10029 RepID=A0A9J7FN54_CRIGR|nr:alkaline ceramidase 3 isoform X2 [Cricetulus griseus]XP_027263513.1 alkaline ceramidase 3 isoform X2 [Cricetulus griseus]ERE78212.1 alkaline ceramidase 3-like protein [Cricetulus griseus]
MAPAVDREGYWGPTTSTLDWCEENYALTQFVAEFWNTVSNLIMIVPPIFGAIQSIRDRLEKRYIAAYLALTVVGMGSWCFHMTLKYEMQLLDELPMIYSCCIFVYCMFECFKTKSSINYHLLFTLVLFSLIVTMIYLKVKEPIFHQVMYGMLVFTLVLRSIYIVTWNFRKRAPPILGVATQFHAWWHILTGLGSYLHILFSLYTRTLYLKYRPKVKFLFGMWPVIMFEPPRKH